MKPALLSLHQVDLNLGGVPALSAVTLRIEAGERVALVGANGSGKSSLLRVLHGLRAPTRGVFERTPCRQAMLFQRPHMLRATALQNVALGLWLDRTLALSWRTAQTRALQALSQVGLAGVQQQNAATLLGGQQQRLALARAWAREPELLFLDEPTASLDPPAKREVEALVQSMTLDAKPVTLVFASHNLGQVKRWATRVIYLEQGQVLADLPMVQFFDSECLRQHSPQALLFVQGETS